MFARARACRATTQLPLNVLIIGDSTSSAGTGDWPALFAASNPTYTVVNRARGGVDVTYWSGNAGNFSTDITNTYVSGKRNCLIHLEGNGLDNNFNEWSNGVHGSPGSGYTNGATAYDALFAPFYASCEAVGWKVYPCTIDMWNDGEQANTAGPLDTFHAFLQASNTRMKARQGVGYQGICLDFASVWPATPDSDPTSLYVVDGTVSGGVDNGRPIAVHKTNPAGWTQMASNISALFAAAVA
jgi:hypothetical protein